jgi:DNA-binding transcriptional LysR family regulator
MLMSMRGSYVLWRMERLNPDLPAKAIDEAVREAVKSGIGVSILSALAVREDIGRKKLASVTINGVKMPRSFYLIHRSGRQQSPLAAAFNEHVLEELSRESL